MSNGAIFHAREKQPQSNFEKTTPIKIFVTTEFRNL
jgi:hypothetical protein